MKKLHAAGIGLVAFTGLGLLIEPGVPSTAFAAQGEAVKGKIVNMKPERSCMTVGGERVCNIVIKGVGISDQGEVINRDIVAMTKSAGTKSAGKQADTRAIDSFAIWTYPDGSAMMLKSKGESKVDADGQRTISGTQVCVGGTGKFAGAECTIDWSHSPQANGLYAGTYSGTVNLASGS